MNPTDHPTYPLLSLGFAYFADYNFEKVRLLLTLCIVLFFAQLAHTQQIVEVVHIEKDDGLKDRTVDRIIRDQNGYFLLFMLNTIQRYDGKNFETIDISAINAQKYEVRDIDKIDMLTDGTIVLQVPNCETLFYIRKKNKRVQATPLNGSALVNQGKLYVLQKGKSGNSPNQIHQLDLLSKSKSEKIASPHLPSDIVEIAKEDALLYLQQENQSIHLLDSNQLIDLNIKGRLAQRKNGVYVFGNKAIYKLENKSAVVVDSLDGHYAYCKILKTDQEQNFIASYSNRVRFQDKVYVLDPADKVHPMDNIPGVSDVFKDFHTDNAFHRWMLGGYNGVHIVNLLREGAEIIHKREDIKKGEFGVVVSGVATNGKEEVVYARELEGFFSYDKNHNTYKAIMTSATLGGDFVRNSKLYHHPQSNKYYSHAYRYDGKSDLYITDLATETYQKYVIPYKLNDIYVLDKNRILFGGFRSKTNTGILGIYEVKKQKHKILRDDTRQVRSITFEPSTQRFWIGTYAGLHVMDTTFTTLTLFDKQQIDNRFMPQDHIIMTSPYQNRMLAASYGGGVYIIDPDSMSIVKRIDESNGLTDNSAIGIMNDNLGNSWITTFNGVNVIDSNFQVIRKIYEHEGLPNREFNSKAIAKDQDGFIYAGTLNGVSVLNPDQILNWKKSCQLDIRSIIGYNGKKIEQLDVEGELPTYDSYDSLVIHYNLPDYHYYPYVHEIIEVNVQGKMDYTIEGKRIVLHNIEPGKHIIDIKVKGQDQKTILKINKKTNFRKAFSILFITLVIGIFAWLVSRQIIQSNKIREEEKTKLNKRIADLQLSALQSQMNPHFIFNALGSIQYFIQTYDTVKADEFLSNFAMLMRSILESSKAKYISLNDEIKLLKLYVGLEKIRFENLFEYEVVVDNLLDLESKIPPMILQPFVENAINHGLYHLKDRKGQLKLAFEQVDDLSMKITISDNGIGRKAAQALRKMNHKSRGMQIIHERIQTINDSQELNVHVSTVDLEDEGHAAGTLVEITISEQV